MRNIHTRQPTFEGFCPIAEAVEMLADNGGIQERAAIYTRREVVDFILDLIGYTVDQDLTQFRLLEPSFGEGDFLLPALDRLLKSARLHSRSLTRATLAPALRGVELHRATFNDIRERVRAQLVTHEIGQGDATALADLWLRQGDYLLEDLDLRFTHVVGNPPYIRQESIPNVLMVEYRSRFPTIYDRADIYVPFIEQSLRLLDLNGKLGFICADRWMKNKYGKKLRALVSRDFSLTAYVDMVDTDAFHSEVSAYPGIAIIERRKSAKTRVFARPTINRAVLGKIADDMSASRLPACSAVREIDRVALNGEPWVLESFDELALVRRLEAAFPLLEEAACKVGIGVATGADKAFIGPYETLDVEPDRKLPLVTTKDIRGGQVAWRGQGVVNPFADTGKLVPLDKYPKLRAYLETHREQIARRHVATKNPHNWYRTIDRIYPDLTWREKLLIPDIKVDASIVYEGGRLYPHHNLYFITSDEWDIHALQAVMCSGVARLFVALYSTKMRGGYLRFQAQYLRKIRLPLWRDVPPAIRQSLAQASAANDDHARNAAVAALYRLNAKELALIEGEERL